MKQTSFFANEKVYFGGALVDGCRKAKRPLSKTKAIHLVLKAKEKKLFRHKNEVHILIRKYSNLFGIKVYGISVQWDHVHLAIKIFNRDLYVKFIRALTGNLSRRIKISWKCRPFTRIISWGRGFQYLKRYIQKNEEEVLGLRPYERRKHRYKPIVDFKCAINR